MPVFLYIFSFTGKLWPEKNSLSRYVTILPAQQDKLVVHHSTKDMLTIKIFNKYFSMTKPSQKSLLNGTFFGIKESHLLRKINCYSFFRSSPKVNL